MALIVIDVVSPPAKLSGTLQRRMLEVRPGVFVGSLSKRSAESLWQEINDSTVKSAIMVIPSKNEMGMQILSFGLHPYAIIDHYGIPLVQRQNSALS